jgi:uncharacterized membrane protein YqgA involved in biofilm formation
LIAILGDSMTGTIINVATVIIGSLLGLLFGARLPERLRQTVIAGLGLFTAAVGFQMFLNTKNPIIVVISLLIGALLGEWWRVEDGLRNLGAFLEARFTGGGRSSAGAGQQPVNPGENPQPKEGSRFIRGFLTASLVYCVGPMAILGALQDGLTGDYQTLAIKSILDGFASLAFASSLGIGVMFSALPVLIYQGSISLLASQLSALVTEAMMAEMTAVGGLLLVGISISSLLEIKPIRVGNFLPALLIAPLIVALLTALNINYIP